MKLKSHEMVKTLLPFNMWRERRGKSNEFFMQWRTKKNVSMEKFCKVKSWMSLRAHTAGEVPRIINFSPERKTRLCWTFRSFPEKICWIREDFFCRKNFFLNIWLTFAFHTSSSRWESADRNSLGVSLYSFYRGTFSSSTFSTVELFENYKVSSFFLLFSIHSEYLSFLRICLPMGWDLKLNFTQITRLLRSITSTLVDLIPSEFSTPKNGVIQSIGLANSQHKQSPARVYKPKARRVKAPNLQFRFFTRILFFWPFSVLFTVLKQNWIEEILQTEKREASSSTDVYNTSDEERRSSLSWSRAVAECERALALFSPEKLVENHVLSL